MTTSPVPTLEQLLSWGQYMHWAEQQFQHFRESVPEDDISESIGTAVHWLAAEYVVLEGWKKLGLHSSRIDLLLSRYPENTDLLRRSRNSVYHYQDSPLDPRFMKVLKDENEEIRWAAALHYEFHGVLIRLAAKLSHLTDDPQETSESFARAIGWFPIHPLASKLNEVYALVADITLKTSGDSSEASRDLMAHGRSMLQSISEVDMYPLSAQLTRMKTPPDEPAGGA